MSTETNEHVVDKSDWPDGPWKDEPDKLVWVDEATDLDCMIVRGTAGALCGYVGVPPEHSQHGKGYDDVDVMIHGGLTYADKCHGVICHVPLPGREHQLWWLGFDCAHYADYSPGMARYSLNRPEETYKDIEYVKRQVTDLAKQLKEMT